MYKTIAIKDLPKCYHKDGLSRLSTSDDATVIVVAKVGAICDWAAYIGWPSEDYLKEPTDDSLYYARKFRNVQDVEDYGDKLSETAARAIFPNMRGEYRP